MHLVLAMSFLFLTSVKPIIRPSKLGFRFEYFTKNEYMLIIKENFVNLAIDAYKYNSAYNQTLYKMAKQDIELILNVFKIIKIMGFNYKTGTKRYILYEIEAFQNLFNSLEKSINADDNKDSLNHIENIFDNLNKNARNLNVYLCQNMVFKMKCYFLYICNKLITYKNKDMETFVRITNSIYQDVVNFIPRENTCETWKTLKKEFENLIKKIDKRNDLIQFD